MDKKRNIKKVYNSGLCCSCTLCSNYCHKNAITFKIDRLGFYKPIVDTENCVNCGVCLNNCPGINDLKVISSKCPDRYCYGYSSDEEMRLNASSGGLATELLCYLLNNKIVDYVTVVTNRIGNRNPRQLLTNDIKVVRECRTSKYCPVSCENILKDIESCEGSVAFIGLPCQINSLKSYYSKKSKSPIKFYISLLCNHTPSLNAAHYLVHRIGFKEKLESILYRGEGWPGKMTVRTQSGTLHKFNFRQTWGAGYGLYFKNNRCEMCNDPFAKQADIVFGDSYFLQDSDKKGATFAIVRNQDIYEILWKMHKESCITLSEGPNEKIVNKYFKDLFDREDLFCKKNRIYNILTFGKSIKTEHNENKDLRIGLKDIIRFGFQLFFNKLGRYRFLWRILAIRHRLKSAFTNVH